MLHACPLPVNAVAPALRPAAALALARAPYLLAVKSKNEFARRCRAQLEHCVKRLAQGESFCESVIVNRASFAAGDFVYSHFRTRLSGAKSATRRRRVVLLDADVPETGLSGLEIVRWIYRQLLGLAAKPTASAANASLKDLRALLLGLVDVDVVLLVPVWAEDLLFRPTQDGSSAEDALLYTLLDISAQLRVQRGKTRSCASWSVVLFLSSPNLIIKASQKVRSRLGLALTHLDNPLTVSECSDFIVNVEQYVRACSARLPGHSAAVDDFWHSYFAALAAEFLKIANALGRVTGTEATIAPKYVIKVVNQAMSMLIKYDFQRHAALEPVDSALVRPAAPVVPSRPAAGRSLANRTGRRGRREAPPSDQSSPESAIAHKQMNKRTSLATPLVPRNNGSTDGSVKYCDVASIADSTDARLKVLFWRHLQLIDLCVLLAWVNLHDNQKHTYITGSLLAENAQPEKLSPTTGAWLHLGNEALVRSIYFLLHSKVLLTSQAQVLVTSPERQAADSAAASNVLGAPFMNEPLIFPEWEK